MSQIITIILPVYNRAELLPRTMRSIIGQDAPHDSFRLVIVDNGSTDNTPEVLTLWADKAREAGIDTQIVNEPAKGAAKARNRGLEATGTPYVMFFDSDDEMRPEHISTIIDTINHNPDADLIYWDVMIVDSDGWISVKQQRHPDLLFSHLLHATATTQRMAMSRELLDRAGRWDESLSTWDDLEFGLRLILNTRSPLRIPTGMPGVVIHPTDDSITGTNHSDRFDSQQLAIDKMASQLNGPQHKNALALLQARRAIYAAHYTREGHADLAHKAMSAATDNNPLTTRAALRSVYLATRIFGSGGSSLALMMFGREPKKKNQSDKK